MAFREVGVTEIREVLRAWLAGAGLRRVAEQAGVDRKTVAPRRPSGSAPPTRRSGGSTCSASAFIAHDGLQCGYCTPGQICSAAGMLAEHRAGSASAATADPVASRQLSDAEIRERMSGNLCRCAAYNGIVDAIREVAHGQVPR